jgi:two-component system response regulator NreC
MVDRVSPLSRRETEVLRLLVLGFTNREVAESLHISVRTAESHRTSIQRKLAVSRRSELVRFALARGMLLGDDGGGPEADAPRWA